LLRKDLSKVSKVKTYRHSLRFVGRCDGASFSELINFNRWKRNRIMKKILSTMMALALTIGAQAQTETVDTAQFVAVYDYECRTQDAEGQGVTDRMQVVVQVGRTVTKSMPRSVYRLRDESEEADVLADYQEAYLHMPKAHVYQPLEAK
jgi:hypothetical protein